MDHRFYVVELLQGGDWRRIAEEMRAARCDGLDYQYWRYGATYLVRVSKGVTTGVLKDRVEKFGGRWSRVGTDR